MENTISLKQKKRAQWAWYLFDFGNSAYAAVVLSGSICSIFQTICRRNCPGLSALGTFTDNFHAGCGCHFTLSGCFGGLFRQEKSAALRHDRDLDRFYRPAFLRPEGRHSAGYGIIYCG